MSRSGSNLKEYIIFEEKTTSGDKSSNFVHQGISEIINHGYTYLNSLISIKLNLRTFARGTVKEFFIVCKKVVFEEAAKTFLKFVINHKEDIYLIFKNLRL